jgi:hypothetical protein
VGGRSAFLDSADVQGSRFEVDLSPQRRSTSSAARRPCLKATKAIVASRWPWRLPLAAAMSRSTSASVRYSRVRSLPLGSRLGGNCSFYGGWRDQLEVRFGHVLRPMPRVYCLYKNHFCNSKSIPMRRCGERTSGPTLPDVAQPPDRLCWKSHAATPIVLISADRMPCLSLGGGNATALQSRWQTN